MAQSRSISQGAALRGEKGGFAPDIAMPSIEEIEQMQRPESSDNREMYDNQNVSSNQQVLSVPQEVPKEVAEAMEQQDSDESFDVQQNQQQVVHSEEKKVDEQKSDSMRDNLVKLRLAKEKAERERDEWMQHVLKMQGQNTVNKPVQQQEPQENEVDVDIAIDDDALVEGKVVKRLLSKVKEVESHFKKYKTETQQQSIETKIQQQFPDFQTVVSPENVELLNYHYPEVAASLRDTNDLYNKAAAAYKIIKTLGISKNHQQEEAVMAKKNINKPRPAASVAPQQGESPLTKANAFANGLTKELRDQMIKEMNAARKGY